MDQWIEHKTARDKFKIANMHFWQALSISNMHYWLSENIRLQLHLLTFTMRISIYRQKLGLLDRLCYSFSLQLQKVFSFSQNPSIQADNWCYLCSQSSTDASQLREMDTILIRSPSLLRWQGQGRIPPSSMPAGRTIVEGTYAIRCFPMDQSPTNMYVWLKNIFQISLQACIKDYNLSISIP